MDTLEYIDRIPEFLAECGLHVPTYICFETPFPGTPHFKRLAERPEPTLLPNVLLRDLNGYTLVTRPRHASPGGVRRRLPADAPRRLLARREAAQARRRSRAVPAARLPRAGGVRPLRDARGRARRGPPTAPTSAAPRSRRPKPCRCPSRADDFASEAERDAILEPWAVTDARGRVLPHWLGAQTVYLPKGRIAPQRGFRAGGREPSRAAGRGAGAAAG